MIRRLHQARGPGLKAAVPVGIDAGPWRVRGWRDTSRVPGWLPSPEPRLPAPNAAARIYGRNTRRHLNWRAPADVPDGLGCRPRKRPPTHIGDPAHRARLCAEFGRY